jgi:thymidylate synthase (FAD)
MAKQKKFLAGLRKKGHMTPFEHASFTFGIDEVSRVTTHQLVRHRVASYCQQSQRYVEEQNSNCVIPPSISGNVEAYTEFVNAVSGSYLAYNKMVNVYGIPKEDARYILPHGWESSIIVTMNARELMHFYELRADASAQWEIKELAKRMMELAKMIAEELFE